MNPLDQVELAREITVVQIPNGNSVTLKKGSPVAVTQSLGGSYTIHVAELGGLYRVASQDSDALGQQTSEKQDKTNADLPLSERIWIMLKTCYDPEIPVNIVDLGLVYSMELHDVSEGKKIEIKMTLTAPGCGMGPSIAADAKSKLVTLPEVKEANIEIVWEPQWNPSMITPDGKLKLGIS